MKDSSKNRKGKMGAFNNRLTEVVDKSDLTPPEVVITLRMLANQIEQLFSTMVRGGK